MIDLFKLMVDASTPKFQDDYIGVVVDNQDPKNLGRLKVRVPELYGVISTAYLPWAHYNSPFGGGSDYGFFMIPGKGAKVRIKLWRNHSWFPYWTGVVWHKGEIPSEGKKTPPLNYVIKTPEGHTLELSDVDGSKYIKFTDVNGDYIHIDSEAKDRNEKISHDHKDEIGNDENKDIGNNWNVNVGGTVTIKAASKVLIDGGGGNLAGVVTGLSICHFTGRPHGDPSADVKASKG